MSEQYVVLYDYQATADNGLNLRQGEIILVHEKGTTGWWNGEGSCGSGWFPESYVQKMVLLSLFFNHLPSFPFSFPFAFSDPSFHLFFLALEIKKRSRSRLDGRR